MSLDREDDVELVVATTFRLDPPLRGDPGELIESDDGLHVELDDGRRIRLDSDDERSAGYARVLGGASDLARPVALVLDDEGRIVRLHLPHVSPVRSVAEEDDHLTVDLLASHGRHELSRSHPQFDDFAALLRDAAGSRATVIVTEDDAHDILDVRPGETGGPPPVVVVEPKLSITDRIRALIDRLFALCLIGAVSSQRAHELFDQMAARTCDPATVPAPCIPFEYPDDGCWGRAHEMARLLIAEGVKPRKVWIQGSLRVSSDNKPNCVVTWGWHVAPTICVRGSGCLGQLRARPMVIDPSLFTSPVTKATWKSVQGDSGATLTDLPWTIFHRYGGPPPGGKYSEYDPTFTGTNLVLADYRLALQNRTIAYGPPPYACP